VNVKRYRSAIVNMVMLYAGRTSGVLVVFIFLPLYSSLLGPEQFGIIAVILSLQTLLVMMDLGMSTMVSRDIAARESSPLGLIKLIRTAEISLSGFYFILLVSTVAIKAIGVMPGVDLLTALASVTLFWLLVLQNLYYSAILARSYYVVASSIQAVGVIVRAIATAFILANYYSTLNAFIVTQLVFAAIHCVFTRRYCISLLDLRSVSKLEESRPPLLEGVSLVKRGWSVVLFSAVGAAVMQLDKPLVGAFVSAASLAPYFLATTLCMLPISILAGPVSQYFQPALLNAVAHQNTVLTQKILYRFVAILLIIIGLPCIIFWFFRMPMIDLWMGQNSGNITIARYVSILLPGCAVGALGYVPYNLLISEKDFKFQAVLSTGLTLVTLVSATVAAIFQSIEGVCYIYAIYHSTATLLSWMRAIALPSTKAVAMGSLLMAVKGCCLLFLMAIVIGYFQK
jgi:O-antigen/teichoic acid export membrane protein